MQIDGTLTNHDSKKHLPHSFDVPAGTTRIDIDFSYGPRFVGMQLGSNLLALSLFDPDGSRGAGHKHDEIQHVTISPAEATPGYFPGTIQPGTWTIYMDAHMILSGEPVNYHFDIEFSSAPVTQPTPTWTKGYTNPRGAGWYRGDLHGHTIHSDGSWDVPDIVQWARNTQLDFVTLSDHNTVSGLPQMDSLAADDVLTMGGVELTTFYGHCLALGVREWMEWRVQPGLTMPDLAARVADVGGLYIIAHPKAVGDPLCTGCAWTYQDMMPGTARVVEIWNTSWDSPSNNDEAVQLWYSWLNQGIRIAATSGTDIHDAPWEEAKLGFNIVYADELSERAILDAVRQGHNYISAEPELEFTGASASGAQAMIGDVLLAEPATLRLNWRKTTPGEKVRLIVNGEVQQQLDAGTAGDAEWSLTPDDCRWCAVEIRDSEGYLRAITNPIYLGQPPL